jgi:diguanylate cyclase (GGDEF)-like protein/PAS domain S-box-containing protein
MLDTKVESLSADFFRTSTEEFSKQFFESVIENATDSIIITSANPIDGKFPVIVYANKTSTKITGYSHQEIVGQTPRILQGEKTDKRTLNHIKDSLKNWETVDVEVLNYKKDGTEFWSHLTITPIKDKNGYFTHWLSIQRDITYKKKIEDETRYNEERLRTVLKAMNSGVWEWNIEENNIFWSDKMYEILGLKKISESVSFEFALGLIHDKDRDRVMAETKAHLEFGTDFNTEFRMQKINGEYIYVNFTGLAKRDANNIPYAMTGSATDITGIRRSRDRVEFLAYHDSLTGLLNRTKLDSVMYDLLETPESVKTNFFALAYIDLDGFKLINDQYGHDYGDEVLLTVASRLKTNYSFADSIFRLGGDEFLILVKDLKTKEEAITMINSIQTALFQNYKLKNLEVESSGSIGVSFYPEHGNSFSELLRNADQAMYQAKRNGKNQVVIYSPANI